MSSTVEQTIHEVDFCGQVATAVAAMHAQDPTFPFAEARLEGFGTGAAKRKRKDLRFFEPGGKLALSVRRKTVAWAPSAAFSSVPRGLMRPDGDLRGGLLCGEVKLPGTAEGRSPYDDAVYQYSARYKWTSTILRLTNPPLSPHRPSPARTQARQAAQALRPNSPPTAPDPHSPKSKRAASP